MTVIWVGKYLLVYLLSPTAESYTCSLDTHHCHSNNTYISNGIYDHVTSYLIYHHDLYIYHCVCTLPISIDFLCFIYTFIFPCGYLYFHILYMRLFFGCFYFLYFISRVLAVCYFEDSKYVGTVMRIFGLVLPT